MISKNNQFNFISRSTVDSLAEHIRDHSNIIDDLDGDCLDDLMAAILNRKFGLVFEKQVCLNVDDKNFPVFIVKAWEKNGECYKARQMKEIAKL